MINNTPFVEDVFKSIKDGIPSKSRSEVKSELTEIAKRYQSLSGTEFRESFIKDAKPIIDTYSRINLNNELSTIRIVLYIFLILGFLSLIAGFAIT